MDAISREAHKASRKLQGSSIWMLLSSLQMLVIVSLVTVLLAVVVERWGLLIVLIMTVLAVAYMTDNALIRRYDPVAGFSEVKKRCLEALSRFSVPLKSSQQRENRGLKARSESIASAHIPDLDADLDSSSSESNVQKKIHLELNSIILLIIRDFVQFWYNSFSYNAQFLKDARHFLFKAFNNLKERIARLRPHKTAVKIITAFREHLASFQAAQSVIRLQEAKEKQHKDTQEKSQPKTEEKLKEKAQSKPARTKLKRLESVDEAFSVKFKFHPALQSNEMEKKYVRSLTKIILLCSCTKDVVSAQSAQLFFVEVLSTNVLLPVIDMLSTPDRLYELLIRLTYNDNDAILDETTLRELIDLEVRRTQLSCQTMVVEPTAGESSKTTVNLLVFENSTNDDQQSESVGHSSEKKSSADSGRKTDHESSPNLKTVSQNLGDTNGEGGNATENASHKCGPPTLDKTHSSKKAAESETGGPSSTKSVDTKSAGTGGKATDAEKQIVIGRPPKSRSTTPKADTDTKLEAGSVKSGTKPDRSKSNTPSPSPDCEVKSSGFSLRSVGEMMDRFKNKSRGVSPDLQQSSQDSTDTTETRKDSPGDTDSLRQDSMENASTQPDSQTHHRKPSVGDRNSGSFSQKDVNLYGDMVSTGLPSVKPKLQAFKDLFKSKKSKLQESKAEDEKASKLEAEKENERSGSNASKPEPEANGKSTLGEIKDSILRAQKIKSLRLSPLLSRSSKSQAGEENKNGAAPRKLSDSLAEPEKKSPNVQQTPSPSQSGRSGPLSFFDKLPLRKPNFDFRRTTPSSETPPPPATESTTANGDISRTDKPRLSPAPVPSVQVTATDDNNDLDPDLDPADEKTPVADSTPTPVLNTHVGSISVSSYEEISVMDVRQSKKKMRLFLQEAEEGEEMEEEGGEDEKGAVTPPDSSLIFQDISIPSTMTCQEFRSNGQFTIYQIEYEALHFSESGLPVLKTGMAKRRYREFVNLMSCLEDNSAYKGLLRDVKGPKRWLTLPFKNMDKDSVASRQKALEQFLRSLIQMEALCNGPELREFLAYEGDSHIAFVRKATEINVPRIDKMLARTVSGVFDKLKSLPSLPGEVISGIRGRENPTERKDSSGNEIDVDDLNVLVDFGPELSLDNTLKDVSERFVSDFNTHGHISDEPPSSPTSQLLREVGSVVPVGPVPHHILHFLPRVEGDGAESTESFEETGAASAGLPDASELPLCDAVLDLLVQLLSHQQHWVCRERVVIVLRNVLGKALDRWMKKTVADLTSEERCLYYIRLLRETVWPGGKFFSSAAWEKTQEEKMATRAVAKRLLVNFFPAVGVVVVGENTMEMAVDHLLESLQFTQLNKHFIYSTLDLLLENIFPEIAEAPFQGHLFS